MQFFSSAIDTLQTLVVALGAGLGVWGVVNLLEGYGSDNPGSKSQGMKQLMAGGGIMIDDFKVVNGKNGIFLGEPSKPDPTTRTGYRSTARVTNRALQERLSAAAADGYNMAVEKLIARAEALRPKPIREQMANAAKEAAKENATRPAPAKGKEARDDR